MASIDFEIVCGICGSSKYVDVKVNQMEVVVYCQQCADEIEGLKARIEDLEAIINDKNC